MPHLISSFTQGQHLLLESPGSLEPVIVQQVDAHGVVFERFLDSPLPAFCVPTMREPYLEQGITWRCWDSFPTDKKRMETPWEISPEACPLGYNPYQE